MIYNNLRRDGTKSNLAARKFSRLDFTEHWVIAMPGIGSIRTTDTILSIKTPAQRLSWPRFMIT
jgi:hypothetical protein